MSIFSRIFQKGPGGEGGEGSPSQHDTHEDLPTVNSAKDAAKDGARDAGPRAAQERSRKGETTPAPVAAAGAGEGKTPSPQSMTPAPTPHSGNRTAAPVDRPRGEVDGADLPAAADAARKGARPAARSVGTPTPVVERTLVTPAPVPEGAGRTRLFGAARPGREPNGESVARPPDRGDKGKSPEPRAGRQSTPTPIAVTNGDNSGATSASVEEAFERITRDGGGGRALTPGNGLALGAAADLAAVRGTFEDLAVEHVAQVRDLMLEVRFGRAQVGWIAFARPALKSLRAMADKMELADVCGALDAFGLILDELAAQPGAIEGDARDKLLSAYEPLVRVMPRAFTLEGERDRREAVIVHALLTQVPGVEAVGIERLYAVGLNRMETLMKAQADEIAVAAGVSEELARRIVESVRAYCARVPAVLSAPNRPEELRTLGATLASLRLAHECYERAAAGWSEADASDKRRHRRGRDAAFAELRLLLARLGEIDRLSHIEKIPFGKKIEALEELLRTAQQAAGAQASGSGTPKSTGGAEAPPATRA